MQPIALKYESSNGISNQNDVLYSLLQYIYLYYQESLTLYLKVYPVFKPNAYFWKHHWDEQGGEEKWQAFARVIREEVMAKSFDFKLSPATLEKKLELRDIIKNGKIKKR